MKERAIAAFEDMKQMTGGSHIRGLWIQVRAAEKALDDELSRRLRSQDEASRRQHDPRP
jgi:hypothetical protein